MFWFENCAARRPVKDDWWKSLDIYHWVTSVQVALHMCAWRIAVTHRGCTTGWGSLPMGGRLSSHNHPLALLDWKLPQTGITAQSWLHFWASGGIGVQPRWTEHLSTTSKSRKLWPLVCYLGSDSTAIASVDPHCTMTDWLFWRKTLDSIHAVQFPVVPLWTRSLLDLPRCPLCTVSRVVSQSASSRFAKSSKNSGIVPQVVSVQLL